MTNTITSNQSEFSRLLARAPSKAWPLLSLIYGALWFSLLLPSQVLWFLPAGLRLAALWLSPTKRWVWLLLGEALVACILLWRTKDLLLDINFIALSFTPWLVYSLVMLVVRGREPDPSLSTPRNMMRFLCCAFFSAVAVSPILSILFHGDAFTQPNFDPGSWSSIFAFAYGDFIGELIVAPLLIFLCLRRPANAHEISFWFLVVLAASFSLLVLLLLHYQPHLAPFLLLLVFAPMFVVAFRNNWMGAAFSVALTGILFEAYLHLNKLPLDLVVAQLAFGLFSAGSLLLGAAMSALRDSHFHLQSQNQAMALMNFELLKNSEELRHLSQRIIRVEEQGQRELASELDAELGQAMHRLDTNLNFAIRSVKEPEAYRILSSVRDPIRDMEDSLRQVLQQLRPKILDEKGLSMAIGAGPLIDMLSDAGISHSIEIEGPLELLNEDQTTAIYRICQIAVRHACKLGVGKHVSIELKVAALIEQTLDIQINITIAVPDVMSHLLEKNPLVGIRDRVLALQGDYQVTVDPPKISHCIHFRSAVNK